MESLEVQRESNMSKIRWNKSKSSIPIHIQSTLKSILFPAYERTNFVKGQIENILWFCGPVFPQLPKSAVVEPQVAQKGM